jgi:superfamily I DNA and/or RNA helicase
MFLAQVSLLRDVYRKAGILVLDEDNFLTLSNTHTIDSAQGREYAFVFISVGRHDGRLRLLADSRNRILDVPHNGRLNVALTRAKNITVVALDLAGIMFSEFV